MSKPPRTPSPKSPKPPSPTGQEILAEAIRLVDGGWTTKAFARNANGKKVSMFSASATCFCAYGALIRAANNLGHFIPVVSNDAAWGSDLGANGKTFALINKKVHKIVTEMVAQNRHLSEPLFLPCLTSINDGPNGFSRVRATLATLLGQSTHESVQ